MVSSVVSRAVSVVRRPTTPEQTRDPAGTHRGGALGRAGTDHVGLTSSQALTGLGWIVPAPTTLDRRPVDLAGAPRPLLDLHSMEHAWNAAGQRCERLGQLRPLHRPVRADVQLLEEPLVDLPPDPRWRYVEAIATWSLLLEIYRKRGGPDSAPVKQISEKIADLRLKSSAESDRPVPDDETRDLSVSIDRNRPSTPVVFSHPAPSTPDSHTSPSDEVNRFPSEE